MVIKDDGSGECIVSGSIPLESLSIQTCWDGQRVFFLALSTDGVTAFVTGQGNTVADCRYRYFVGTAGATRLVGSDDTCRAYDGVVVDGWDIWTQSTEQDYALPLLSRSTLLARSPDGVVTEFGAVTTGSLIACGQWVYWYSEQRSEDSDGSTDVLNRWSPGSVTIEQVFESGANEHAGGTRCADGIISTAVVNDLTLLTTSFSLV